MMKLIKKINGNVIMRNLVLAACLLVILLFVVIVGLTLFTRHNQYIKVPTFKGMTLDSAKIFAINNGLILEINDSINVSGIPGGTILVQNPKAEVKVKEGRRVFVTINSYNKSVVEIPYVTGFSLRQAKNNIQVAGLEIKELIYKDDIATNNILEQIFNGATIEKDSHIKTELGTGITLIVGKSSKDSITIIPDLLGLTLYEAKSRLWESGLNVGTTTFDKDISNTLVSSAKVYAQSIRPIMASAHLGETISLGLTNDNTKIKIAVQQLADTIQYIKFQIIEQERIQDSIANLQIINNI